MNKLTVDYCSLPSADKFYKMKSRRRAAVEAKPSITASVVGVSLRWTCRRTSAFSHCSSSVVRLAVRVCLSSEKKRSDSTVVTGMAASSCYVDDGQWEWLATHLPFYVSEKLHEFTFHTV